MRNNTFFLKKKSIQSDNISFLKILIIDAKHFFRLQDYQKHTPKPNLLDFNPYF